MSKKNEVWRIIVKVEKDKRGDVTWPKVVMQLDMCMDQGGMRGLDSSRLEAAWKQFVASAIRPSSLWAIPR